MDEFYFSNENVDILFQLLNDNISSNYGYNTKKYPQLFNMLLSNMRSIYARKDNFPEIHSLQGAAKVKFLNRKVLQKTLPDFLNHIKMKAKRPFTQAPGQHSNQKSTLSQRKLQTHRFDVDTQQKSYLQGVKLNSNTGLLQRPMNSASVVSQRGVETEIQTENQNQINLI